MSITALNLRIIIAHVFLIVFTPWFFLSLVEKKNLKKAMGRRS